MSDCKERILPACDKVLQEGSTSGNCPSWSVCLPFGGNLSTEGGCVHYEPPRSVPPDGEYTKIVIVNGCIVDAKKADIPLYTSSPCAPVPAPCDCAGSGEGSGSLPDPSSQAGNLYRYDAAGRPLVRLTVQSGTGVSVTGSGTATDPLIITNTQEVKDNNYLRSGSSAIVITGEGTASDPKTITHKEGHEGTIGGMTFDAFGHLVGYQKVEATDGVNAVVGNDGVSATMEQSTRVVTVSLEDPVKQYAGQYLIGGYQLDLDHKNRITKIEQFLNVPEGDYAFGAYDVSVNNIGSVTAIRKNFDMGVEYAQYFDEDNAPTTDEGGSSSRTHVFTLRNDSYLRVEYEAVIPAAHKEKYKLRLNGRSLPTMYETYATCSDGLIMHLEAITPGVMASGPHTVQVVISGGLAIDFTKPAKLLVTPSWVFDE